MTDYFSRLVTETETRVWVNNPTVEELGLALDYGAVGCTTNPAYGGGLLKRARAEVLPVIDRLIAKHPDANDEQVADYVQEDLVSGIANRLDPLFEASRGRWGYVSVQGSPENDTEAETIWAEAQAGHAIAANATPKIPATAPGFVAMERVVTAGWPIIVTEVFSVDQLVVACELYLRVTSLTGHQSPFFISPITGIFGDHLKKLAARWGLGIPQESMELAGIGLARRCASLVRERHYPVRLLFGGARTSYDLVGLVGAAHCATINWSTFADILALDPPIEDTIEQPLDPRVEDRLLTSFSDVRKSWELGSMSIDEFAEFGPVQHFRDNFLAGWRSVVTAASEQRKLVPSAGR